MINGFDRFWSAYPRKVAKGAALKAWNKLNPDSELTDKIVLAIDAQKRHRRKLEEHNAKLRKEEKRFLPDWKHPSTWLNGQCWEDEIPSTLEAQPKTRELGTCEDCGAKHNQLPAFKGKLYCCKCYDKHAHPDEKQKVYDNLKRIGLGKMATESRDEWLSRVRDAFVRLAREYEKRVVGNHPTQRPSSSLNPEIRNAQGRVGAGEV